MMELMVLKETTARKFENSADDLIKEGWVPKFETFKVGTYPEINMSYLMMLFVK